MIRERGEGERGLFYSQTLLHSLVFSFFVLYCFHGRRNPLETHNGGTVVKWDCHKAGLHMNRIKAGGIKVDYKATGDAYL